MDMKRPVSRGVMRSLHIIEWAGLLLITMATMVAVGQEVMLMVHRQEVLLQDILLLFIYLEIFTMVGLYFSSGKLHFLHIIVMANAPLAGCS